MSRAARAGLGWTIWRWPAAMLAEHGPRAIAAAQLRTVPEQRPDLRKARYVNGMS